MKNVTCEIILTGMKTQAARLKIGILLFKFAVWVTGMKGEITVGGKTLGEMRIGSTADFGTPLNLDTEKYIKAQK